MTKKHRPRQIRGTRKKKGETFPKIVQPKAPKPKEQAIVFSYWPLLRGMPDLGLTPGKMVETANDQDMIKEVMDRLDEDYNFGVVELLVWTMVDGKPAPIFVMDKAAEIAEHLKEWSEDAPASWFTLKLISKQLSEETTQYAMALMPDLQLGLARLRKNTEDDREDVTYLMLFKPISFSGRGETFNNIEADLDKAESVPVSFVDIKHLDLDNPMDIMSIDQDLFVDIGEINLVRATEDDDAMVNLMEDQTAPLHQSWVNPDF